MVYCNSRIPPRKEVSALDYILRFLIAVIAGAIIHLIGKWLYGG